LWLRFLCALRLCFLGTLWLRFLCALRLCFLGTLWLRFLCALRLCFLGALWLRFLCALWLCFLSALWLRGFLRVLLRLHFLGVLRLLLVLRRLRFSAASALFLFVLLCECRDSSS
jgi:hypothetical protein